MVTQRVIRYLSILFGAIGATTFGAFFVEPAFQSFIAGLLSSLIGMVLTVYTED